MSSNQTKKYSITDKNNRTQNLDQLYRKSYQNSGTRSDEERQKAYDAVLKSYTNAKKAGSGQKVKTYTPTNKGIVNSTGNPSYTTNNTGTNAFPVYQIQNGDYKIGSGTGTHRGLIGYYQGAYDNQQTLNNLQGYDPNNPQNTMVDINHTTPSQSTGNKAWESFLKNNGINTQDLEEPQVEQEKTWWEKFGEMNPNLNVPTTPNIGSKVPGKMIASGGSVTSGVQFTDNTQDRTFELIDKYGTIDNWYATLTPEQQKQYDDGMDEIMTKYATLPDAQSKAIDKLIEKITNPNAIDSEAVPDAMRTTMGGKNQIGNFHAINSELTGALGFGDQVAQEEYQAPFGTAPYTDRATASGKLMDYATTKFNEEEAFFNGDFASLPYETVARMRDKTAAALQNGGDGSLGSKYNEDLLKRANNYLANYDRELAFRQQYGMDELTDEELASHPYVEDNSFLGVLNRGFGEDTYGLVNNPDRAKKAEDSVRRSTYMFDAGAIATPGGGKAISYMTDAERNEYNTIHDLYGEKVAREYLDTIQYKLQSRKAQADTQAMTERYQNAGAIEKTLLTASTLGLNLVDSLNSIFNAAGIALGGDGYNASLDPNSGAYDLTRATEAIRTAGAESFDQAFVNAGFPQGVGSRIYNIAMSAGDNGTRMLIGVATGGTSAATLALCGMGSAQATMYQELQENKDPMRVLADSAVSGAIEVLTEKIPTDDFFKMLKSGKGMTKQVLEEILEEEIGQFAGDVYSTAVDTLFGDITEAQKLFVQYQHEDPDMSDADAWTKVVQHYGNEYFDTAVDTLLSTLLLDTGSNALNKANATHVQKKFGKNLQASGMNDMIVDILDNSEDGSAQKEIAAQIHTYEEQGEAVPNDVWGKAFQSAYEKVDTGVKETITNTLADSLQERMDEISTSQNKVNPMTGEKITFGTMNADLSKTMADILVGNEVTEEAKQAVAENDTAMKVLGEFEFGMDVAQEDRFSDYTPKGKKGTNAKRRATAAQGYAYEQSAELREQRSMMQDIGDMTKAERKKLIGAQRKKKAELDGYSYEEGAEKSTATENNTKTEEQHAADVESKLTEEVKSDADEIKTGSLSVSTGEVTEDIVKVKESKEGNLSFELRDEAGNTKTASLSEVQFNSAPVADIAVTAEDEAWTADKTNLGVQTASTLDQRNREGKFTKAFSIAYDMAFDGTSKNLVKTTLEKTGMSGIIDDATIDNIYNEARQAGKAAIVTRAEQARNRQAELRRQGKFSYGIVTYEDGTDPMQVAPVQLTTSQKASIQYASALSKLGYNVVFTNDDALFETENGHYDPVSNTITLHVRAGEGVYRTAGGRIGTQNSIMLNTLSHELTHYIQQNSPEMYEDLKTRIVDAFSNEMGRNWLEDSIRKHMDAGLDRSGALNEVIADACETMLQDETRAREIFGDDRTAWQKFTDAIKEVINNIQKVLKDAFAGTGNPYRTEEGKALYEKLNGEMESIKDAWYKALGSSLENVRNDVLNTQAEIEHADNLTDEQVKEIASPVLMETPNQLIQRSTKTWRDDVIEITRKKKVSGRDLYIKTMKANGYTEDQIYTRVKFIDSVAQQMDNWQVQYKFLNLHKVNEAKLERGRDGKYSMTCVVPNAEYPINIDFSTICDKRSDMTELFNEIAKRPGKNGKGNLLDEVNLTPDNLRRINQILKEAGYETACFGCFVESKRYQNQKFAQDFCDMYNAVVDKVREEQGLGEAPLFGLATNPVVSRQDALKLGDNLSRYNKSKKETGISKSGTITERLNTLIRQSNSKGGEFMLKHLTVSDLITSDGLDTIANNMPELLAIFNSHYGQGRPKNIRAYVPYSGEVARFKLGKASLGKKLGLSESETARSTVDKMLKQYIAKIGGLRNQSFSDFIPTQMFDALQMLADCQARGFTGQCYTKNRYRAWLMGMCGMKTNLSLMFLIDGDVDEAHAGLDKDGNYLVADYENVSKDPEWRKNESKQVQSFSYSEAQKIETSKTHSKYCGAIGVGHSYHHMVKMMNDYYVPYVIGYHKSDMPMEVAEKTHLALSADYTGVQNIKNMPKKFMHVTNADAFDAPTYATWSMGKTSKQTQNYNGITPAEWIAQDYAKTKDYVQTMKNLLQFMGENQLTLSDDGNAANGHGSFDLYGDLKQTGNPKQTADNLISWCLENNTIPLFYEFCDNPYYFKNLYDFSVLDLSEMDEAQWNAGAYADGNGLATAEQVPVNFDTLVSEEGRKLFFDKAERMMDLENKSREQLFGDGNNSVVNRVIDEITGEQNGLMKDDLVQHQLKPDARRYVELDYTVDGALTKYEISDLISTFKDGANVNRINSKDGKTYYMAPVTRHGGNTKIVLAQHRGDLYNVIEVYGTNRDFDYNEHLNETVLMLKEMLRSYGRSQFARILQNVSKNSKTKLFYRYSLGGFKNESQIIGTDTQSFRNSDESIERQEYIRRRISSDFPEIGQLNDRDLIQRQNRQQFDSYQNTAILKEDTLDKYLLDYASQSSPKYAQAYITYMRPSQFLDMTPNDPLTRYRVSEESYELNPEEFANSTRFQPIQLNIDSDGKVIGHQGRHRMTALDREGITHVPVLIFNTKNKYSKEIGDLELKGQDSEYLKNYNRMTVNGAIPLSYDNRELIKEQFATKTKKMQIGERVGRELFQYQRKSQNTTLTMEDVLTNADSAFGKTDAEKDALRKYQDNLSKLTGIREQISEQNKIIRAKADSGVTSDDKTAAKNRIEILRKQSVRLENEQIKLGETSPMKAIFKRARQYAIDGVKQEGLNEKNIQEIRNFYQMKIKKERMIRDISNNMRVQKNHIENVVNRINKLRMNETDYKNVPEELKPLADSVVKLIADQDSLKGFGKLAFDRKSAEKLSRAYEMLSAQDDANAVYDEDTQAALNLLVESVDELNKYPDGAGRIQKIGDTYQKIRAIRDALDVIESTINHARQAFFDGQRQSTAKIGNKFIEDNKARMHKGSWSGKAGKVLESAEDKIGYGNLTPDYYFRMLNDETMTGLNENIHEAENQYGIGLWKARAKLAEIKRRFGKDWSKKNVLHLTTDQGREITLTQQQAMSLYATWKREHQEGILVSKHLENGGFVIESDRNKGMLWRDNGKRVSGNRISEKDFEQVLAYLTKEEQDYVDAMVDYLSHDMSEYGNKTSMDLFGIKKYKEQYYFPISSFADTMYAKSDAGTSTTNDSRIKHASFTHARLNNAQNAVLLEDFDKVIANHVNQMLVYSSFAVPIESMNRALNYSFDSDDGSQMRVRSLFKQAYGEKAARYLQTYMKDLQGGSVRDRRGESLADSALSTFRKSAVAGSLSVAFQQPLSYIRAAYVLNPKYLAMAPAIKTGKDEMLKYSGVGVIKQMGKFDTGVGMGAIDYLLDEEGTVWDKITEYANKAPEVMDNVTWAAMWKAVKAEQMALNPKTDFESEEFLVNVGKRFNQVMRLTQVYDSVLSRSQTMRSKNLYAKMFTSFMAQPTLTANMLFDAVNGEHKAQKLAKAVPAFLLSAILQAAVKGAFTTGRKDDDERTRLEQFVQNFFAQLIGEVNPLNLIPGYNNMVTVLSGSDVTNDAYSVYKNLFNAIGTAGKFISTGEGSDDPYKLVQETIGFFTQVFTNLPVKNIMRDGRAMVNLVTGAGNADRETSDAVIKYSAVNGIWSDETLSMLETLGKKLGINTDTDSAKMFGKYADMVINGDADGADDLMEYMKLASGKSMDSIRTGMTKAFAQRILDDKADTEDVAEFLAKYGWYNSKDDAEKKLIGKMKTQITTMYKNGKINQEQEHKMLKEFCGLTDNDIWKMEKLEEQNDPDSLESNTIYKDLYNAIDSNGNVTSAKKELTSHGYKADDVDSTIKSYIKSQYKYGVYNKNTATTKFRKYCGMSDDDIFWVFDEVEWNNKHPNDKWSANAELNTAIGNGDFNAVKSAVDKKLKHGYTLETGKKKDPKLKSVTYSEVLKQYFLDHNGSKAAETFCYKVLTEIMGKDSSSAKKTIRGYR